MKKSKVPLKASNTEITLTVFYSVLCFILWLILIACSLHLLSYYFYCMRNDIFDKEAIRICVYLIVGAFFVLFINRDQAQKIFKVKKN